MSDMDNLYKAPESDISHEQEKINPTGKVLFRSFSVGLATFFGGFIGGALVLATNYHRLGRQSSAKNILAFSVAVNILLIGILVVIEIDIPAIILTIVQVICMNIICNATIGTILDQQLMLGGEFESNWKGFGLGLIGLIITLLLMFICLVVYFYILTGEWDALWRYW